MQFFDYVKILYKRGFFQLISEIKENYFFDKKFNIDTQDRLNLGKYQLYTPSYEFQFLKPINYLREKENLNNFCFYDIGSGKGKILFLASSLNFFKIVGIEKNYSLFKISLDNKNKLGANAKVTKNIIIKNGSCFDINYGAYKKNLIFYMYNPLDKISTIKFVNGLKKYRKNKSQKIYLIFTGENKILKKINLLTDFQIVTEFKFKQFNRDIAIYKL